MISCNGAVWWSTTTGGDYNGGARVWAMLVEPSERRSFTVDEVYRMVESGILAEDEHVELLGGELCPMSPQGTEHSATTVVVRERLREAFGEGYHLRDHSPIRLDDHNLPEPDVAVVRGPAKAFLKRLPTGADVALVVEIAVTSQERDRNKAALYAAAGIASYWILDLQARTLTVHQSPTLDGYRSIEVLDDTDAVLVPAGGGSWPVAQLLP